MLALPHGAVSTHVPLTARASTSRIVGPPRTPEFRAAQFRQRGESICGRNEQITIIKYKTENLRGKTDYKNEKKYEK